MKFNQGASKFDSSTLKSGTYRTLKVNEKFERNNGGDVTDVKSNIERILGAKLSVERVVELTSNLKFDTRRTYPVEKPVENPVENLQSCDKSPVLFGDEHPLEWRKERALELVRSAVLLEAQTCVCIPPELEAKLNSAVSAGDVALARSAASEVRAHLLAREAADNPWRTWQPPEVAL